MPFALFSVNQVLKLYEPCATSRTSRRGGGLQRLVRWLAANRTLQLGRANWGREGKLPHVGPRWDFPDDLALGLW